MISAFTAPFIESTLLVRRTNPVGSFFCLALLVLAFATAATGQNERPPNGVVVQTELAQKRIGVGELNQFTITVYNGIPMNVPESITADGLVVQRTTQRQMIINGRAQYDFAYTVVGKEPGEFTIPSLELMVQGQTFKTDPATIEVFARKTADSALDASRPYFAVLDTELKDIYENQMIPFTLTVYARGQTAIQEVGPPQLSHDAIVMRRPNNLTYGARELEGTLFSTAMLPGTMFALKEGEHTIGPAELTARIVDSSSRFGPGGFLTSMRNRRLATNTITLKVKPLPPGAPASFTGGVGDFKVSAVPSTTEVTQGDPISIELTVEGIGNLDTLEAPVFLTLAQENWKTYDARKIIDPAENSDGITSGKATFSQIVIPQAEVEAIPSFELTFFDPLLKDYVTRTTRPIPITVKPDPRAQTAAVPVVSTSAGQQNGLAGVAETGKPAAQFNDILTIKTMTPRWREMPVAATSQPAFWIGQAVPSIVLFTLLGVGLVRWIGNRSKPSDDDDTGPALPFPQAVASIPGANSPRPQFYRAVKEALTSWERDLPESKQENLSPDISRAMKALDSRCEWLLYGAEEAKRTANISEREMNETRDILRRLGSVLPSAPKTRPKARQTIASAKPKSDDLGF